MLAPLALLAVLASGARAELFVTRAWTRPVERREKAVAARADLELGRSLILRGVELVEQDGREAFRLPLSAGAKDGFADIRVLSEPLFAKMLTAMETRTCDKKGGLAESLYFDAAPARLLGSAERPANVEVTFAGELSVTIGVVRQGGRLAVAYPSERTDEGRRPLFQIIDEKLRRNVENAVLARARRALGAAR